MRLIAVLPSLLVLASAAWPVAARQEAPSSPQNASYVIAATLDPANRQIRGHGRLTWRNTSTRPATELQFHLYWNAWRDDESSWMRQLRLLTRSNLPERTRTDPASIDLTRLSLTGAQPADLLPDARYIAPDDGNEKDRTVLSVPLDRAVLTGETIEVDFSWTARVPRTFDRTGAIGNFFFIAQWFPKIGVLEEDGWTTHQFHPMTEFFADFGAYDVSLTVPDGWIVAATGQQASRTVNNDGTATHRYTAGDVHDFAWSTSPDFVEVRRPFERENGPAIGIRLLLQPEHAQQAERHLQAAHAALERLGRWFGPYPYPQLTIVDPVTIVDPFVQGGSAGGMEYPTLVTGATNWYLPLGNIDPEDVLVHEIVHQYFQGVVATNEVEHAWMDEGLTTYLTARILDEAYPQRFVQVDRYFGGVLPWSYDDVRWSRIEDGNRREQYRGARAHDVPSEPTWRYWPQSSGSISYPRTALWLHTLERMLGWDTMRHVLGTYFTQAAWRHPEPEEFFQIASVAAGRDLTWFFDTVHRQSATFDYAVTHVDTRTAEAGLFHHSIIVRRLGSGIFPVDVRVDFNDGTTMTERWDGAATFRRFEYQRRTSLRQVVVDPDGILLLDTERTNNSWTSQPRAADAAARWALRWMTWLQQQMLTYAFFV